MVLWLDDRSKHKVHRSRSRRGNKEDNNEWAMRIYMKILVRFFINLLRASFFLNCLRKSFEDFKIVCKRWSSSFSIQEHTLLQSHSTKVVCHLRDNKNNYFGTHKLCWRCLRRMFWSVLFRARSVPCSTTTVRLWSTQKGSCRVLLESSTTRRGRDS